MIKTILGLILLLIPFLFIFKFKDKKIGFVYVLSFFLGFHLLVAVVTQLFYIFTYWVVFIINLIVFLLVLIKINLRGFSERIKEMKIDWMLVFIVIVVLISLFSVHYNYTGDITAFEGVNRINKQVENMKYPYVYFSDEWSAVSLVKYSIVSHSLPIVNPLWLEVDFSNFELPFHSFVSEIVLLLDLNVLIHYNLITVFTGLLICLLVYLFLRFNNIGKLISGITSLSLLYVVNGTNLPGIWYLIPLILGLISMLLSLIFMQLRIEKMILFTSFLCLIFYPPLFVLHFFALVFYFLFRKISLNKKIRLIISYLFIGFAVTVVLSFFVYLTKSSLIEVIDTIFEKLFYETFTKNAIPDFAIWKVVPISVLFLGIIGIFGLIKNRGKQKLWLIASVVVGLIYWFLYSKVLWRFIIEYERVVFATSVLIILISGFGLFYLVKYLKRFEEIRGYRICEIVLVVVLVLFLVFSFSYTQRNDWQNLKLYAIEGEKVFSPASPANNYLHEDDLRLFKEITEKNFLTIPWKGLVIGVATNNYPLNSKESTISNSLFYYNEFMNLNCDEKLRIAKEKEIDYVYSTKFDCQGFEFVGDSEEGFSLYEVSKKL